MTRNPLASPDMIGITQGAGAAVVGGIVLGLGAGSALQTLGLAGALVTALLIYALAWKRGTTGYRIVLVGIGVYWMCVSATRLPARQGEGLPGAGRRSAGWSATSTAGAGRAPRPSSLALAVLVPLALLLGRWLRTLHLGDDVAGGLGTPVQRGAARADVRGRRRSSPSPPPPPGRSPSWRSPRRRSPSGSPAPPAPADRLGAHRRADRPRLRPAGARLFPGLELPVGVVTGALGAPFLLWLLVRANRIGSGG